MRSYITMKYLPCALLLAGMAVPLFANELRLFPGCEIANGSLTFKNKESYAEIRDSHDFGSSGKGMTFSAAVWLPGPTPIQGSGFDAAKQIVYKHDMIVSKGNCFVFGRRNDLWVDQLYCNFYNGNAWAVPLKLGVKTPPYREWAVWTVTVCPQERREEGRRFSVITFYLNGEPCQRLEVDSLLKQAQDPVRWGTGTGINGDLWSFRGKIAEQTAIERVLNDDEVFELASRSRLVKINPADRVKVPAELNTVLHDLEKNASAPLGKWMALSLRRAAENGYGIRKIEDIVSRTASLWRLNDVNEIVAYWNRLIPEIIIIPRKGMFAMLATGEGRGVFPLIGIYDCNAQRGIFGRRSFSWRVRFRAPDGSMQESSQFSSTWRVHPLKHTDHAVLTAIHWTLPCGLTAWSNLKIDDRRISMDFQINNPDHAIRLESVNFPVVHLAVHNSDQDFLVHPCQSGVLYPNPANTVAPAPAWYPSGWCNMQFGAYYDNAGGIYFSPEDPTACSKQYTVRGRGGDLELEWRQSVPYAANQKGGNSFRSRGRTVLELFSGDWFSAVEIYRRFVREKADWGRVSRPRNDTPAWLRENTLWLSHWTFNDRDIREMPGIMRKLRNFFALPFAVHWYRWYDSSRRGMPHFVKKDGVRAVLAELQRSGIRAKAYIDTRLWSELDGPGYKSDREFRLTGRPCAVVNSDGSLNYERYHPECREVVMCPAAKEWQRKIRDLTVRTAGYGFDMIYHDQVGASRPFACYSGTHGHPLNSDRAWTDGYYRMFRQFTSLRNTLPELCHDTEDANEAYLPLFDGFLAWRWNDNNQIPLFSAVYSGYAQFTGREYDQTTKGAQGSFFAKTAAQLVQAEQIGWFTVSDLFQSDRRLIFAKQSAHLRKLLLPYFNEGEMLAPLKFRKPVPRQTMLWGTAASNPHNVTSPKVLHSVWKHPLLGRMVLWVNASDETVSICPVAGQFKGWNCGMEADEPQQLGEQTEFHLLPYRMAVWVEGSADYAGKISDELTRIAAFSANAVFSEFNILIPGATLHFNDFPHPEALHTNGCLTLNGNGKNTQQYKIPLRLKPATAYRIRCMLRKKDSDGYLAVVNYTKDKQLRRYALTPCRISDDGKWHSVEFDFTSDAGLHNCGLYIYNKKGTFMMNELSLQEIVGDAKKESIK